MIGTYILKCKDDTYYVGNTDNLERRLEEHNRAKSRYTESRRPFELVFKREFATLKEARKFEYFLKRQRNKNFYQKLINGAFV